MRLLRATFVLILTALPLTVLGQTNGGGLHTTNTFPNGTTNSTSTVSLTIPGIIGIDVESDPEFNFTYYTQGTATEGCLHNRWPPSIACQATDTIHLDPMTAAATLGTHTTTGLTADAATDDTAIWMAVFCSRAGTANTFVVKGKINVASTSSGLDQTNFVSMAATNNNGKGIGFGTFQKFSATNNTDATLSTSSSLGITFPWTRVDQAVALEFLANTALTETATTNWATLTYTVSKP